MLNEKLKQLRKEAGMSQETLAKKMKTTQGTIGKYERGDLELNPIKIEQVCHIFHISPNELFGWEENKEE